MTSPAKSSRRRRSAMIANGSAGSSSNSHHPLSHSHSRRQPFYPSSKIKSSVAWRLLASRAVRRQFAWGRLVEALSSSARSWLTRPNVLFWFAKHFSLLISSLFLLLLRNSWSWLLIFHLIFPPVHPFNPFFSLLTRAHFQSGCNINLGRLMEGTGNASRSRCMSRSQQLGLLLLLQLQVIGSVGRNVVVDTTQIRNKRTKGQPRLELERSCPSNASFYLIRQLVLEFGWNHQLSAAIITKHLFLFCSLFKFKKKWLYFTTF